MDLVHYALRQAVSNELDIVRREWSGFSLNEVPLLAALVASVPASRSRAELLRRLLDWIDPPAKDGTRDPLEERDALDTGMMGRIIFGEAPPFKHVRGSYDPSLHDSAVKRYNAAAAIRGEGKGTLMRPGKPPNVKKGDRHSPGPGTVFLTALAERIALEIERLPAIDMQLASPVRTIVRTEFSEAQAILERQRRLWISGEPGTGKSVVAMALARRAAPIVKRIEWGEPLVDGSSVYVDQLRAAVHSIISPRENSATELEYALTALLRSRTELVVVFDGLPAEKVNQLTPEGGNAYVVCIGDEAPDGWPEMTIGDLSASEASDMLASRLPGLDSSVLGELVDSVGTRPAMLDLAARSIRDGYFSPESLCEAAYGSVIDGLDAISIDASRQPMTRHYSDVLNVLSEADRTTLTRLAWFTSGAVRTKTAISLLAEQDERSDAAFRAALSRLSRLGLLKADETRISVSSLTRRVVRGLTADRLIEETTALLKRCQMARAARGQPESAASLIGYEVAVLEAIYERFQVRLSPRVLPLDRHHFLAIEESGDEAQVSLLRVRKGRLQLWDSDAPGFRDPDNQEGVVLRNTTTVYHIVQAIYCIAPPDSPDPTERDLNMENVRVWLEGNRLPFDPVRLFSPCCTATMSPSDAECPQCSQPLSYPVVWAGTLKGALESIPNLQPKKYEGWEDDYAVLYAAAAWCARTLDDEIGCEQYLESARRLAAFGV